MKVLWFSHITLIKDSNSRFFYPGGNWITELKDLVESDSNVELGIVFYGEEDRIFKDVNGTTYFEISKNKTSKFSSVLDRWKAKVVIHKANDRLFEVIDSFKPSIIHIFGTESSFGTLLNYCKIPAVIHLQGILNPCLNSWMFPGLTKIKVLRTTNFLHFARGLGFYHEYYRFKKMAQRELEIFKLSNNFMGRTRWDYAVSKLYAPNSNYFHCDEVIRDCFYNTRWDNPKNKTFTITTVMNPNIYKGLDLILKTAVILNKHTNIEFTWNIYGVSSTDTYVFLVENVVKHKFHNNSIRFIGKVLEDSLLSGMLAANLYVHSSYIDNSPNTVCEAQLIGMPVVSTNVGGISSLIEDRVDGILVPPNEPHILASTIVDLYSNPKMISYISNNACEKARKRHNKNKIKEDLLGAYKSIILIN